MNYLQPYVSVSHKDLIVFNRIIELFFTTTYTSLQRALIAYIYTHYMYNVWVYFTPCGMGVRIQPTPALRRVVRGDYLRGMSYPLPPAHCMQGLLACNGAYELG